MLLRSEISEGAWVRRLGPSPVHWPWLQKYLRSLDAGRVAVAPDDIGEDGGRVGGTRVGDGDGGTGVEVETRVGASTRVGAGPRVGVVTRVGLVTIVALG